MTELKRLRGELLMTSIFREVIKKPLFLAFMKLSDDGISNDDKISAYAEMTSEIHKNGGSLSALVSRLVFEDENVYIRTRAKKRTPTPELSCAVEHELKIFSEFAGISAEVFMKELGVSYVTPYATERVDLVSSYEERILGIDKYGFGVFSSYPMFRLSDECVIEPIKSADRIAMDSFVGYEEERGKVIANTVAFVEGRPAANTLLCGDAGTGKSSTVKAVANSFFDSGVRLIELRKDQLKYLPYVMGAVSDNPLKFIIFIDDLSFNNNDDNFSMLKAALEGSASAKADNAVIYATSNRRHIVKETFGDRDGDDVHINDTMQEILSLSERFGLVVLFQKPNKNLYLEIVHELADRADIKMDKNELDVKAEAFALRKGNRSARCAEQFIESLQ